MKIGRFCLLLATAIPIFAPSFSHGITLGQIDSFEDGTKQGWEAGPSLQILSGGPGGPNDHYIKLMPGGSGPGMLLQISNGTQWSGNYLAAGVTGVEMDLINFATDAMPMRVAIGNGTTGYGSTTAISLPADGQWHHLTFAISAASMTAGTQAAPFGQVISNVPTLNVFDSNTTQIPASGLNGFGLDNIHAIPEPSTICLAVSATIGLVLFRRRCNRVYKLPPAALK